MKKKYGDNIQLLFTDTDSTKYEVCNDNFFQDMLAMNEEFFLSSYPKSNPFHDPTNNKGVVKFKVEAIGNSITEFGGLKPKMYSYQTLNDPSHGEAGFSTEKRAKGIQRAAVGKLRPDQFKAQLDQPEETYVPNRRIGFKLHQIYGI